MNGLAELGWGRIAYKWCANLCVHTCIFSKDGSVKYSSDYQSKSWLNRSYKTLRAVIPYSSPTIGLNVHPFCSSINLYILPHEEPNNQQTRVFQQKNIHIPITIKGKNKVSHGRGVLSPSHTDKGVQRLALPPSLLHQKETHDLLHPPLSSIEQHRSFWKPTQGRQNVTLNLSKVNTESHHQRPSTLFQQLTGANKP